jgi:ribosome-binding protein aMBF1 (putative translation factor)
VPSQYPFLGYWSKVITRYGRMPKTIFSAGQQRFLKLLRQTRENAGMTQVELAKQLKLPQSFVSKIETGERRVDIVELEAICKALRTSLTKFVQNYEQNR